MENPIVVVKKGVKRVSLQRGICTLICYSDVDLKTIHVLFQNQLWLETKVSLDKQFAEKYGKSVLTLSEILKQTNLSRGLSVGAMINLKKKIVMNLDAFIYPSRNLDQISSLVKSSFRVRSYKEQGIPTKEIPPKAFIGIGYRDKGTARNPAEDGSPSWQEVATFVSNSMRRIEELFHELEESTNLLQRREIKRTIIAILGKLRTATSRRDSQDAEDAPRK